MEEDARPRCEPYLPSPGQHLAGFLEPRALSSPCSMAVPKSVLSWFIQVGKLRHVAARASVVAVSATDAVSPTYVVFLPAGI
jgi:hypothetical protein